MQYNKRPLTIDEQVQLLQKRGMTIADEAAARTTLERISYYRISAYALPWKQAGDTYSAGASFEEVVRHYEFDRLLRNLAWEAIEPLEVLIRTRVTHHLATTYGTFAHVDPSHFIPTRPAVYWDHAKWLAKVEEEAERSHEVFVDHYRKKYAGFPQLPMWMATEIMSFGSLSKLYGAMFSKDQRVVARSLNVHEAYLPSWLHTISVIRNTCAHHGRLWYRGLGVKPALPQEAVWQPPSIPNKDRVGCVLFMLNHLLKAGAVPCRDDWRRRVEAHLTPMLASDQRWVRAMGMPAAWPSHPLWG